jgi:hypothetical protein
LAHGAVTFTFLTQELFFLATLYEKEVIIHVKQTEGDSQNGKCRLIEIFVSERSVQNKSQDYELN